MCCFKLGTAVCSACLSAHCLGGGGRVVPGVCACHRYDTVKQTTSHVILLRATSPWWNVTACTGSTRIHSFPIVWAMWMILRVKFYDFADDFESITFMSKGTICSVGLFTWPRIVMRLHTLTQGVDQRNLRNNQVIVCVTLIRIDQVVRGNHGLCQWWRSAVYVDATPWQTDKHTALHSPTQRQVHADSLPSLHTHRFVLLNPLSVKVLLLQGVYWPRYISVYYVVMLLYMWWKGTLWMSAVAVATSLSSQLHVTLQLIG